MQLRRYRLHRLQGRNGWVLLTEALGAFGYHLTEPQIRGVITNGLGIFGTISSLWSSKNVSGLVQ
mgnify:CR=1 FL=1